jgi:hypothetical protein
MALRSKLAAAKPTVTKALKEAHRVISLDTKANPELVELAEYVDSFAVDNKKFKEMETSLKGAKSVISGFARANYLENPTHNGAAVSSVKILGPEGGVVMVSFPDTTRFAVKTAGTDDSDAVATELVARIGEDNAEALFEERFSLSITSAKIPEDKQTAVYEGMKEMLTKLGLNPDDVIALKMQVFPTEGYNSKKLSMLESKALSKEQFDALEELVPTGTQVKEGKL